MAQRFMMGNEAFAHAALEAGLNVAAGYPGTPSSEILETIAKLYAQGVAQDIHVEWSTNEKAALEVCAGAAYAGARTLYTCKQVGLNVASDALMSLNYVGVKGGCVLIVADDPGPISSQTEQDTRRFAAFAKVPVFDPATPEQACAMIKQAYELSEAYQTPVIVRPTTRICHASTFFEVEDTTKARAVEGFDHNPHRFIFPARAYEAHGEINKRLSEIAEAFSSTTYDDFNPVTYGGGQSSCVQFGVSQSDRQPNVQPNEQPNEQSQSDTRLTSEIAPPRLGIVAGGISYAYAQEALRILGDEAHQQGFDLPSYTMIQIGTPYPFPQKRIASFLEGCERVIVFEELDHVLEDELLRAVGKLHLSVEVMGKCDGTTCDRGENTVDAIADQLRDFFAYDAEYTRMTQPPSASVQDLDFSMRNPSDEDACELCFNKQAGQSKIALAAHKAPARPPLLCPGCPHRGAFYAVKQAARQYAKQKDKTATAQDWVRYCSDIGCYTLGNAAPLNIADTCLCMGAGITIAQGFSVVEPGVKGIAFVGDSTFFASGMTGVANAVYNNHDVTICVLDNATTAMTGSQPHPGTGVRLAGGKSKPISIEEVLRALGVTCIVHANPLDLKESVAAAREALYYEGPSAILFESPCVSLFKPGVPVVVDREACTGCMRCVNEIGCPALSFNEELNVVCVDSALCNGCSLCEDLCAFGALSGASQEGTC